MKKITDVETARKELKDINKESLKLIDGAFQLREKLTSLERFFRNDQQRHKNFHNASNIRSAGNEMLRLERQIPKMISVLKHLSALTFPVILEDVEPKEERHNLVIIDKNVGKITPIMEDNDEEEQKSTDSSSK